jgi:hypothetical protein
MLKMSTADALVRGDVQSMDCQNVTRKHLVQRLAMVLMTTAMA